MGMWFIVLALLHDGHLQSVPSIAEWKFDTYSACMASAAERTAPMREIGAHGSYLCMYHSEPDAELAATRKVRF